MTTPSALAAAQRTRTLAERLQAKLLDADLLALGLPEAGVAAVAPRLMTRAEELALCRYVLGVIARAGLAPQFRALAVLDAVETGNTPLAELLGACLATEATPSGPPTKRWQLPAGVPALQHAEPVARELASRLLARETVRAETRTDG